MATVHYYIPTAKQFYNELQERSDIAENRRLERHRAVVVLQRMTRGYLIRKHFEWLAQNAITIQCAFRQHRARKIYRERLKQAVREKHRKYYAAAATKIQALWRGYDSRRKIFFYRLYREWLARVSAKGEEKIAEAKDFRLQSRIDDLRILEEEARQWLAFVIFKLHHLMRTFVNRGVYSDLSTNELSEFEKLLQSIRYMEYMKRLKRKYNEFVQKHRPLFSNKRLFPVIGDGADYWYLSLPEMYELTYPAAETKDPRHLDTHHGLIHKQPFLWKKVRPPRPEEKRGPFKLSSKPSVSMLLPHVCSCGCGDTPRDPRFHLYVQHYKPRPELFDYVDLHINILLNRKSSIENVQVKKL